MALLTGGLARRGCKEEEEANARKPLPISAHPRLPSPQVSGFVLRIPQALPADSGEYVCRVSHGSAVHEASLLVTIKGETGSYCKFSHPPPVPRALGWRV